MKPPASAELARSGSAKLCALILGPPKTKLAFLFRLITAHVAELTRPFDEAVQ
jgi:hypothetical protein